MEPASSAFAPTKNGLPAVGTLNTTLTPRSSTWRTRIGARCWCPTCARRCGMPRVNIFLSTSRTKRWRGSIRRPARQVRLWSLAADKLGAWDIAWSPDNRLVATADDDPLVRLWDSATGRLILKFEGHTDSVYALRFSPDGKRLTTGSTDGTARIWNVATERRGLDVCEAQGTRLRGRLEPRQPARGDGRFRPDPSKSGKRVPGPSGSASRRLPIPTKAASAASPGALMGRVWPWR